MTLISPAAAVAAECGEEERAIACPGERERERERRRIEGGVSVDRKGEEEGV
jgi:LDH2 family malate/lactate/ureidoglycolate dehydrogenase